MAKLKEFDESVDATKNHKSYQILPSKILADHANNHRRVAIYDRDEQLPELKKFKCFGKTKAFCFTRAEVLARVDSLRGVGQQQRVGVSMTNTGLATLEHGYLRHAAAAYLEATGELEAAKLKAGLRCDAVQQPNTPEAQLAAVLSNGAENDERKATSPLDDASYFRTLKTLGLTPAMMAADPRIGKSASFIEKRLRLLTLSPAKQLAVHEGRLTADHALAEASERGEGSASGPRRGIKNAAIERALSRGVESMPAVHLSGANLLAFVAAIKGVDQPDWIKAKLSRDGVLPLPIQELIEWLDAPAEVKEKKPRGRPRKLSALKPGEAKPC